MDLVFATNNLNKLKEVQALIPSSIKLISLKDIGCFEDIPETQNTIEGNAIQKAEYIKKYYGYDCFADDTGLEVEALNGAPGVYSARYAGEQRDTHDNMNKLLDELANTENRNAQFRTVICLIWKEQTYYFEGICKGHITTVQDGTSGFGYDPVFIPEGSNTTFANMDISEKNKFSHRKKAVQQLINFLNDYEA